MWDPGQGQNKNPDSVLQSQRVPLNGKFLELHILSLWSRNVLGLLATGRGHLYWSAGTRWPLPAFGRPETRPSHKPPPLLPQMAPLPPQGPGCGEGASRRALEEREVQPCLGKETGSWRGPEDPHFSAFVGGWFWRVILSCVGHYQVCKGEGKRTRARARTHTHAAWTPIPPPDPGDILTLCLAWGLVQSWCSINGC